MNKAEEASRKFQQKWKNTTDALIQQEVEKSRQVRDRLKLYQQEARIKAQDLQTRYGKNVDDAAIRKYLDSVNKLKNYYSTTKY